VAWQYDTGQKIRRVPMGDFCRNPGQILNHGDADVTGATIHVVIASGRRIRLTRIATIMAASLRMIAVRMAHVMRCFLVLFRAHVTEPGLQRLGTDRQNEDENPELHHSKIDQNLSNFQQIRFNTAGLRNKTTLSLLIDRSFAEKFSFAQARRRRESGTKSE
jgi:hypothetical protein